MKIAVYAGSFDPITLGHLDILKEACQIFDKVIIAVAYNEKKSGFLSISERIELIKECTKDFSNIEIDTFEGLTVEYAKKKGASVLVRGLRNASDFDYEKQLSDINRTLCAEIKTVFIMAKPEYSFISSSAIREILRNSGDISKFAPIPVIKKFSNKK